MSNTKKVLQVIAFKTVLDRQHLFKAGEQKKLRIKFALQYLS